MKQSTKTVFWVLGIVAIIGALLVWTGKLSLNTSGAAVGAVTSGGPTNIGLAIQPSVSFQATDQYNGSVVGQTARVYSNGNLVSTSLAAGSAQNVAAGNIEAVLTEAQHYAYQVTAVKSDGGMTPFAVQMSPNGTLTNSSFNSFGQAGSTTIGANDNKIVKLIEQVAANQVFSNPQSPNNPIICLNYNTTELSSINLVGAAAAPMPLQAVGTYKQCFVAPFKSLANGADSGMNSFAMQSTSTNPACATQPTGIIYDQELFIAKDGSRQWGVENTATGSAVDVGGANPTFSLGCA